MDLRACIPTDKDDTPAIERAGKIGFPAINPILPELLAWMQDMNWPVARALPDLLSGADVAIVPPLGAAFASNDSVWKYWLLTELCPRLAPETSRALTSDLRRLATAPSEADRAEEVDVQAGAILAALQGSGTIGEWEPVLTVNDYWDCPRTGVAEYRGSPHAYRCEWDDAIDEWSSNFLLSPLSAEQLAAVLEDRSLWHRYQARAVAGTLLPGDEHPALAGDRHRHGELRSAVEEALAVDERKAVRAAGEFRRSAGKADEWEVRWADVDTQTPGFGHPPISRNQNLGPSGDGDEIAPLREVEREFGVTLDYRDAHGWTTVGDVYAALLAQLSAEQAQRPDLWQRFAQAICRDTGISPASIAPQSELIAEDGLWVQVVKVSPFVLLVLAAAGLAGLAWVLR